MLPFIPSWLNQACLTQAEFRVYCCLASRADNSSGIAWPKAETIAKDCMMAKNTVWKSLRTLEERGLIRRVGKPFQGSSRYQVLSPIGANEIPVVSTTSANEIPVEGSTSAIQMPIALPIGANETPPIGANQILQSAQIDSREGNPKKVIQGRVSNTYISDLADSIWKACPLKGRERSSKKQLASELKAHAHDLPNENEILESLAKWLKSDQWSKDGGQFVCGIHLWVKRRKWEIDPEPARDGEQIEGNQGKLPRMSLEAAAKSLGRRARYLTPETPEEAHARRNAELAAKGQYPEPMVKLPILIKKSL